MKKGISLPINVLIILAIAVVVLAVLIGFLMRIWGPSTNPMICQSNFQSECMKFISAGGCKDPPEASISDPQFEDLRSIANNCYQISGQEIANRCCHK